MKDSSGSKTINHTGVVRKVGMDSVTVSISKASACSGCHTEGSCNLSGKEEKIVDIPGNYNLKTGDIVTVMMIKSIGYAALFIGYLLPLISVISTLAILISIGLPELTAGLASLAILIPYYFIIYVLRKRISTKFKFMLKV